MSTYHQSQLRWLLADPVFLRKGSLLQNARNRYLAHQKQSLYVPVGGRRYQAILRRCPEFSQRLYASLLTTYRCRVCSLARFLRRHHRNGKSGAGSIPVRRACRYLSIPAQRTHSPGRLHPVSEAPCSARHHDQGEPPESLLSALTDRGSPYRCQFSASDDGGSGGYADRIIRSQ